MQLIAAEMNLAETAFLQPESEGFRLRWFTPAVEVELCGHATLASAHWLYEKGVVSENQKITFYTHSGTLYAHGSAGEVTLNFPVSPVHPVETPQGLEEALGLRIATTYRSPFDYLVELESEAAVRSLQPDMNRLKHYPRGVIVTARSDSYDFVSRMFGPAVGIPEDPVTGSAHCALAAYWQPKLGKAVFQAYQASMRGGALEVTLQGDRVLLKGKAFTVMNGELQWT